LGGRPQVCFIMKLLVGTDGSQKMSKTVGNTVDFEDPPNEKYGKLMSIPDSALPEYLELATDIPEEELAYLGKQIEQGGPAARDVKKRLAREVVAQFDGEEAAQEAERVFEQEFSRKELSGDLPMAEVPVARLPKNDGGTPIAALLVQEHLAPSMSEARRLLKQGAVERNGETLTAAAADLRPGDVLRVGKHRFLRIVDAEKDS
jgi:tyrosyl-tRNA synthetase